MQIRPLCYLVSDHSSRLYPLEKRVATGYRGSESDQEQSQSARHSWHLITAIIGCAFMRENKQLRQPRMRAGMRRNTQKGVLSMSI
jgi:hypothetical protein